MPRFQLIYGERNTPKEQWNTNNALGEFGSPQEAAALVKQMNAEAAKMGSGLVYMMKKLADEVDFKSREYARATFKLFEVQGEDHHMAELDGTDVTYYPTLVEAYEDRRTKQKLGRYLKAFTSLNDTEIEAICARYGIENADRVLGFARTREEIKKVYHNGPRSCMSGDSFDFKDNIHPCEAYATDDIAVAYLKREGDSTRYSSRAVVNMKDKTFGSIYGDTARMEGLLSDAGFKKDRNYWLVGCRMLKLDVGLDRYAAPYLDSGGYYHDHDETYMIVQREDNDCYATEYGYISQDFDAARDDDYDDDYDYD